MKNIWNVFIFVVVSILAFIGTGLAETFECAFLQDKYESGKSNKASCSMLPEKVYSTKDYTPKKNEHCEVIGVYLYEDLEDVKIDTEKSTVSWVEHTGFTEDAKKTQKKYYLKEGKSAKEADKDVNIEHREHETYRITAYYKSQDLLRFDAVMKKVFDPPKKVTVHTIIFTNGTQLFYLYIPESSGYAILLQPSELENSSWVDMRFGNCRKLK
jgi:hypothetical protein